MNRLLVGVVVSLSACGPASQKCEVDRNCPSGQQCTMGQCVDIPTGGGGGSTGGGTGGGGMTGGGTGGGTTCDVANCAVGQECGVSGCEAATLEIVVLTKPTTVGPNAAVVTGRVQRQGGGVTGVKLPTAVAVAVTPGLMASGAPAAVGAGGDFSFTLQAMPGASGTKQVTVSFQAAAMVQTQFNVNADTAAPGLGLVVPTTGVFKRDSVVTAILTSDEGLADAGVVMGGATMTRVADGQCANYSSTPDAAACFVLDFSAPVLDAMDGGFAVALSATDGFGNSGGAPTGPLQVTRVRWVVSPTTQQIQALAVGSDGTLFAGTSGTGTNTILALNVDSGVVLRDAGAFGEVQALAVAPGTGGDVVYAAFNPVGGAGSVGAVEAASLQRGSVRSPCEGAPASKTYSGLALYRPASETFAVGSVNSVTGVGGTGCLYRPYAGPAVPFGSNAELDATVVVAVGATTATNVVINGTSASFLTQDSSGAWWQPVTLNGTSTPVVGARSQFGSDASAFSFGQAVLGAQFIVGGAGATNRLISLRAGAASSGDLGAATADKGVVALASSSEAYVGLGDALVRFDPSNLSVATPVVTVASDPIRSSPILGVSRLGRTPEGYAVTKAGKLAVFRQSATPSPWQATLFAGDQVLTHMAFDCNRASPTTKTGVLYVGTASGKVMSIIVDSPRLLDTAGAWPKYQRSMGNAGNTDLSNFPTNWASCPL